MDASPNAIGHVVVGAGSTLGYADPAISDAVCIGGLVFLSGRADVHPETLRVRNERFEAQARSVLTDIDAVLLAAGSSPEHVLRVECFLSDAGDFEAWNRIWTEFFPVPRPARTTIVTAPTIPGLLIELSVTAAVAAVGHAR